MSDITNLEFLAVKSSRGSLEAGLITGTVFEYLLGDKLTGIHQSYAAVGEDVLKLNDQTGFTANEINRFLLSMKAHGLPFEFKIVGSGNMVAIMHGSLTVTVRLCEDAEKSMFASPKLIHRVPVRKSARNTAEKSRVRSTRMVQEELPLGYVRVEHYLPKESVFFVKD